LNVNQSNAHRIPAETITLQGEDLQGLEFVLAAPEGPLLVNGRPAPASIADSVADMCGALVSLTLAPDDGATAEALAQWLCEIRAPV
jgi:hypothetical protein